MLNQILIFSIMEVIGWHETFLLSDQFFSFLFFKVDVKDVMLCEKDFTCGTVVLSLMKLTRHYVGVINIEPNRHLYSVSYGARLGNRLAYV